MWPCDGGGNQARTRRAFVLKAFRKTGLSAWAGMAKFRSSERIGRGRRAVIARHRHYRALAEKSGVDRRRTCETSRAYVVGGRWYRSSGGGCQIRNAAKAGANK